jgi:hypothetical protein
MILKLKSAVLLTFALSGFLFAPPSQAQSACITFEPPDFFLGDVFGRPAAQVSGNLAFSSNGIDGYVYNFLTFAGPTFNRADVVNAPIAFSPGQSLRTNNINIQFDFTNLPFTARKVTFLYLDLGGNENLAPNPGGIYVGELSSAPPVLNGTNVTVSTAPVPGGKRGSVTITAPAVNQVRVGGQELWIDSVCATP